MNDGWVCVTVLNVIAPVISIIALVILIVK